jgi:hypothetical protein
MFTRAAAARARRSSTQRKPFLNVLAIRVDVVNLGGVIIHSDTQFC